MGAGRSSKRSIRLSYQHQALLYPSPSPSPPPSGFVHRRSRVETEIHEMEREALHKNGRDSRASNLETTKTDESTFDLSQYLISPATIDLPSPLILQASSGAWITAKDPVELRSLLESSERALAASSGGHYLRPRGDPVGDESEKMEAFMSMKGKEDGPQVHPNLPQHHPRSSQRPSDPLQDHSGPSKPPPGPLRNYPGPPQGPPRHYQGLHRGPPPPPPVPLGGTQRGPSHPPGSSGVPTWNIRPPTGPSRPWPGPVDGSESDDSFHHSDLSDVSETSSIVSSNPRPGREGRKEEHEKMDEHPEVKSPKPTTPPPVQSEAAATPAGPMERPRLRPDDGRIYLSLFWVSQMNVFYGFWATPWMPQLGLYPQSLHTWIIMQSVIIEALSGLITITYSEYGDYGEDHRKWLVAGKSTWPPYAINANNGVVVGGKYTGVKFPMFSLPLPPVRLCGSPDHQKKLEPEYSTNSIVERQVELAYLDSWLSLCGRLREIDLGAAKLIQTTPVRIDQVVEAIAHKLVGLRTGANEGGFQDISSVVYSLTSSIETLNMGEAEAVFFCVALLRTIKVGICIMMGPSTRRVMDDLQSETPVFLV